MQYIAHRINTAAELAEVPPTYGVEIDLRDRDEGLTLQHDPFVRGEDFGAWLAGFHHGTLILNVKSERIEDRILEQLQSAGVTDFFFLDSSFPMIVSLASRGIRQCALRLSEYETIETVLSLAGRIDWVWVDCFTRLCLDAALAARLRAAGFRICLVSPELQGRPEDIAAYAGTLRDTGVRPDAICTKLARIPTWQACLPAEAAATQRGAR